MSLCLLLQFSCRRHVYVQSTHQPMKHPIKTSLVFNEPITLNFFKNVSKQTSEYIYSFISVLSTHEHFEKGAGMNTYNPTVLPSPLSVAKNNLKMQIQ